MHHPFAPPPAPLTVIGPKFGWLHGNQCLGRIQGACRVALVVAVSITELLRHQFSPTEPADRCRVGSANLLTSVN